MTARKRPSVEDEQGMRDWMMELDYKMETLMEWMEGSVIMQQKHAPFIDRMMKAEEDRDELYKSVRSKVIGSGLFAGLSMLCAMLWFAITQWMGKQ